MPIVSAPHELLDAGIYVDLYDLTNRRIYMKCDGFNFGGSAKLRSAAMMVAEAERDGLLSAHSVLIESSSGNLGVALSMIAAAKGLKFTCVTDSRCNRATLALMRSYGADVVLVTEPHPELGFLGARLDRVRELCAADPRYLWLNQYTNEANWQAHYDITAAGIDKQFPDLDVVFCGVGTGGTAMGCARYFRDNSHRAQVVGVDAIGSVSFGQPNAPRFIPGLGSGIRPPLLCRELLDDVVFVSEPDTIRCCRALCSHGLLMGGSTGTVLCGALDWLDRRDSGRRLTSVLISPDLGDRYLDTIYDDEWVSDRFGPEALVPRLPGTLS